MSLKVAFYGLDRQVACHRKRYLDIVAEVLDGAAVLQGPPVSRFEEKMAKQCGRRRAVAVGSCTDALAFSLEACGAGPGKEVLVTAFSFIASVSAILRVGATPVFVDIDPRYFMMDLEDAARKVTPRTRFLVAVHLFGQCLDHEATENFARRHDLTVIEDAAQAVSSAFAGRPAGSMGRASCLSFDPTKILGAFGSGGMVLTDDGELADEVARMRYHGRDRESREYVRLGYNSQLPSEQAALLEYKLELLPEWDEKRNRIARLYQAELEGTGGLTPPAVVPGSTHTWHKFVLRTGERDRLARRLKDRGIQTMVHYPTPLCDVPLVRGALNERAEVPVTRETCLQVLSLPIYPELTEEEARYVATTVKKEVEGGR